MYDLRLLLCGFIICLELIEACFGLGYSFLGFGDVFLVSVIFFSKFGFRVFEIGYLLLHLRKLCQGFFFRLEILITHGKHSLCQFVSKLRLELGRIILYHILDDLSPVICIFCDTEKSVSVHFLGVIAVCKEILLELTAVTHKNILYSKHAHLIYKVRYFCVFFLGLLFLFLLDNFEFIFRIKLFRSHESFPDGIQELFFTTFGSELCVCHHIGIAFNLYVKDLKLLFVTLKCLRQLHQASVGIIGIDRAL